MVEDRIVTTTQLVSYRNYLESEEKSAATVRKYLHDVGAFFTFVGDGLVTNLITGSRSNLLNGNGLYLEFQKTVKVWRQRGNLHLCPCMPTMIWLWSRVCPLVRDIDDKVIAISATGAENRYISDFGTSFEYSDGKNPQMLKSKICSQTVQ